MVRYGVGATQRHNSYYEKVVENGKETITDITDEIPFDIPPNWTWCRLEYSCSVISTKNIQIKESDILKKGVIPVVTQSANFIEGFSNKTEKILKVIKPLVIFGDHTLNVKYVNFDFVVGADGVKILESKFHDNMFFYYRILCSSLLIRNRGYSRHFQFLKKKLLPLPPIEEQKRIVEAIENFTNNISSIDEEYSLIEEKISLTKSKLLDLAIRGKLLPQDANDEPASVLLDRIRKEKESSNKTTKGKRKAADSYIFKGEDNLYYEQIGSEKHCIQDEIPFDIPDSWAWTRLKNLSEVISKGTTPRGGNLVYLTKGIGFLRVENIGKNFCLNMRELRYIDKDIHNSVLSRSKLNHKDILISIAGTLGKIAYIPDGDQQFNANQAIAFVRLINKDITIVRYIANYLSSGIVQSIYKNMSKTTAIPNLTLEIISKILIPFPPFSEQKRIVDYISKANNQLDLMLNERI